MVDNRKVLVEGFKKAEAIKNRIVLGALIEVCRKTVESVRSEHPFENFTWNLEQSIACAVYHNNQVVYVNNEQRDWGAADPGVYLQFGAHPGDGVHDDGPDVAMQIIDSYSCTQPWEILFVAGADYAASIEKKYQITAGEAWGAMTIMARSVKPELLRRKLK